MVAMRAFSSTELVTELAEVECDDEVAKCVYVKSIHSKLKFLLV